MNIQSSQRDKPTKEHGYARVNGLNMYYEIEGTGEPLVVIHPALQFAGLNSFPSLLDTHSVIPPDLQGHGRTADIPERPLSIEQYAKDVAGIPKGQLSKGGPGSTLLAQALRQTRGHSLGGLFEGGVGVDKAPFLIVVGDCDFVRVEHAADEERARSGNGRRPISFIGGGERHDRQRRIYIGPDRPITTPDPRSIAVATI
jgi:hypothetical protein